MNEPIGRRGSLMPERARMIGVGDELDRLVLADDPLVQDLVEAQQLLPLALLQPADRDAGPARHDLGDLVLGDDLAQQPVLALLGGELLLLGLQPALQLGELAVAQLGGAVEVVAALGLLGLVADPLDLRLAAPAPSGCACRSASHWARIASASARRSASSLRSSSSRALLAGSFSLASAASSISSRVTRRVSSSSSAGIESISVRSSAQASSTRSMALSGRNRSVM